MSKKFKIILWDIDGTILDFKTSESVAIKMGFERMNLGNCSDQMVSLYSRINERYWAALERGEKKKPDMLVERFEEFFSELGIDISNAAEFNKYYQSDLGETICFFDDAPNVIRQIDKSIGQYVVTNGSAVTQHKKMKKSGLIDLMDGYFISEELGGEKPGRGFFEQAFIKIKQDRGSFSNDEVLIIGDSLTSDILGGNNAGINTCWYNPAGKINDRGVKVDYEIKHLSEVLKIIE